METTVITTTCGIIYSRQVEWLMWKSGCAANKIEGRIGQFLCDLKQCPHCPWQVTETWIAGPAASSVCQLPFSAGSSCPPAPNSHLQRLQVFHLEPRKRKQGPFKLQQPGGCKRWQPSSWHHRWLLRQPEDRWDSWGPMRESTIIGRSLPLLTSGCADSVKNHASEKQHWNGKIWMSAWCSN